MANCRHHGRLELHRPLKCVKCGGILEGYACSRLGSADARARDLDDASDDYDKTSRASGSTRRSYGSDDNDDDVPVAAKAPSCRQPLFSPCYPRQRSRTLSSRPRHPRKAAEGRKNRCIFIRTRGDRGGVMRVNVSFHRYEDARKNDLKSKYDTRTLSRTTRENCSHDRWLSHRGSKDRRPSLLRGVIGFCPRASGLCAARPFLPSFATPAPTSRPPTLHAPPPCGKQEETHARAHFKPGAR